MLQVSIQRNFEQRSPDGITGLISYGFWVLPQFQITGTYREHNIPADKNTRGRLGDIK
jgi:hypothetical protein